MNFRTVRVRLDGRRQCGKDHPSSLHLDEMGGEGVEGLRPRRRYMREGSFIMKPSWDVGYSTDPVGLVSAGDSDSTLSCSGNPLTT